MLKSVDRLDKVKRMRVADRDVQGLKTPYEVRQQLLLTAAVSMLSSVIHRQKALALLKDAYARTGD